MKKLLFFILIIITSQLCTGQESEDEITVNSEFREVTIAKKTWRQIAKDYFRSDPFNGEFGEFLRHLINDPTLINKTISQRTDTNFFYLRGEYKTHQPFFFKAKRTHVIVAESEEKLIDSLPKLDTIITYQLAGYSNGILQGEAEVKREFEKFHSRYKKKFPGSSFIELKNGNKVYGGIYNYFILSEGFAPLSVAWQKIEKASECVFVITFRFRVSENVAILPAPSNSF